MKKFIYPALVALSVFTFASCDILSGTDKDSDENNNDQNGEVIDKKDPNEELLASYYKPLVGDWEVVKWYGSYLDGSVEKTFDYTEAIEKVLCGYSFWFGDGNIMFVSFYDGNDSETIGYDVSFRVGVPNFFRAESIEESTYLDYEIVKVTESTLHLKESASNATSHFECVKR